jgi:hypothetical protein
LGLTPPHLQEKKLTEFFAQLTDKECLYAWFQQDSASVHTTDNFHEALEGMFVIRKISGSLWPACLYDVNMYLPAVTGLPLWRPGLVPRSVHVGFVVGKVAKG